MSVWHAHHGRWWAVQWCFDGWFSLGVHVDIKSRKTAVSGTRYGPYVDFHLGPLIVSLGVNPIYSTDVESLTYRGGYSGRSS